MSRLQALLIALLLAGPTLAADEPFSVLDFDAAAAKAKADGKLLLVDFTATWCPPCKLMEKQTWPEEKVRAWVAEHAVAIQVDVDKAHELAQKFDVQAIPTMVFLKDDQEVDRHAGFRGPDDFVKWGEDVLAGRSAAGDDQRSPTETQQGDDVEARYRAARDALAKGDDDVALQGFLWLWPHTLQERGHGGIPLSFVAGHVRELALRHRPTRTAFLEILDELGQRIDAASIPALNDWRQWTSLCDALQERARVLSWYERRRNPEGRLRLAPAEPLVQNAVIWAVFDALVSADRDVDAVRLYDDVRDRSRQDALNFAEQIEVLQETIPAEARAIKEMSLAACRKDFRSHMAMLHAAALADGRDAQAAGVAADLLAALDDAESRTALVTLVLDLGAPRPPLLAAWLDEAAAKGADVAGLRARLAAPAEETR